MTGLLRITEPHGGFLHDNDPAHDRWYSRDVEAIAQARGLSRVAPYFIDADAAPAGPDDRGSSPGPIGGLTVIAFRNDHLLYAITWFSLALLCAWAARRLLTGDRATGGADERAIVGAVKRRWSDSNGRRGAVTVARAVRGGGRTAPRAVRRETFAPACPSNENCGCGIRTTLAAARGGYEQA